MLLNAKKTDRLCITRDDRHRGKLLTCALCVALALPGMAMARKPATSSTTTTTATTTEGCAVLLPAYIETGSSFSVKVVRVPSYTGSWTHPTIYTDVAYPTTTGDTITQNNTQTINNFSVTYALASFVVPSMNTTDIANSPTDANATASVTATISEPLSNNKAKLTTCSATTPVIGVN
jgi:hypothetical protein